MGGGNWSRSSYSDYSATTRSMSREQIFAKSVSSRFSPNNVKVRESRDSKDHPVTTPIILGLDETGSMGVIPERLVKGAIGTFMDGILSTEIVPGPQLCFLGIGDVLSDLEPLEITQFESDMRIVEQLSEIHLEGGGGGNGTESYELAWHFGAYIASTDSFEKRQKKGYLFTVGDEGWPRGLTSYQLSALYGRGDHRDESAESLLEKAQEKWNVFHILVNQRAHYTNNESEWREHFGKHLLVLGNHEYLSELLLATIRVNEGEDPLLVVNEYENQKIRNSLKKAFSI